MRLPADSLPGGAAGVLFESVSWLERFAVRCLGPVRAYCFTSVPEDFTCMCSWNCSGDFQGIFSDVSLICLGGSME